MANKFTQTMSNVWYTENWAVTLKSSLNKNLDFFFVSGTWWENTNKNEIIEMFNEAFDEDKNLALKNLFNLRDVRQGKGRRRAFRIIWNEVLDKEIREKLKKYVPEFGRYDDLLESNLDYVAELLKDKNTENYSLLCKWIPRRTNHFFKLAKMLNMNLSDFRKLLSENTKVVESQMCKKEFDKIEYSKIPSLAFKKYRNAFERNDENRFNEFISLVNSGEKKMNASNILPADVYNMFEKGENEETIKAIWKSFEDIVTEKNFIPVIDVSSSMQWVPMRNAIGLGVYLAENNKTSFKDFAITFHESPSFIDLTDCEDIIEKFEDVKNAKWWWNTDLQKTFDIILERAKQNNLKDEDMPESVIILSDMEFDQCEWWYRDKTNLEAIKEKYKEAGFKMPNLLFWNLNGRSWNVVCEENEQWVFMISGFSTNVVKTFMSESRFANARELMEAELLSERYSMIHI